MLNNLLHSMLKKTKNNCIYFSADIVESSANSHTPKQYRASTFYSYFWQDIVCSTQETLDQEIGKIFCIGHSSGYKKWFLDNIHFKVKNKINIKCNNIHQDPQTNTQFIGTIWFIPGITYKIRNKLKNLT